MNTTALSAREGGIFTDGIFFLARITNTKKEEASLVFPNKFLCEGLRLTKIEIEICLQSYSNLRKGRTFLIMIPAPEVIHFSFLALLIRPLVTLTAS
jgi:hypothetical protein